MRILHLVGESLPSSSAVQVGELTTLVPLDARHGVFPNLVMTPLMSLVWACHMNDGECPACVWTQVKGLLEGIDRRFNIFTKHAKAKEDRNPVFEVLDSTSNRLREFDTSCDLWATFGYQTVFGLIRYMLTGEACASKRAIQSFAGNFLKAAAEKWTAATNLPKKSPSNGSAQEGYLHRLCTDLDANGDGVVPMLEHAIEQHTAIRSEAQKHLHIVRCLVPLLHNEAYQISPHGLGQANFVLAANYHARGKNHAQDLYWKIMGHSIRRRMLVTTVPTP